MKKIFFLIVIISVFLMSVPSFLFTQEQDYVISINDVLEISVYDEPDLAKTVRVSEDGTINYVLLGNIKAAGVSVRELESRIARMLAQDYLVNPQVSIFIKEFAKISVLGQVNSPGSYELKGKINVVQAIALAGGFTKTGDPSQVKIIRKSSGKEETLVVDTENMTGEDDDSEGIFLKPGDVVFVEEYGRISVLGQVSKPDNYILQKGLTALDAIALAGGFTKIAAVNATSVIRIENGKKITIRIHASAIMRGDKNQDVVLMPGDTIVVPESFF